MTRFILREVIAVAGLALQSEDCAIRAAVHHRNEKGGLDRIQNERHRQFIVWRAVLPVWHAEIERHDNTDLVLTCENGLNYFEMKNWTGSTGGWQLPGIRRDVQKLQARENGFILITSLNPVGQTQCNFKHMEDNVPGLNNKGRESFCFPTVGREDNPLECWIAGWPVLAADYLNLEGTT